MEYGTIKKNKNRILQMLSCKATTMRVLYGMFIFGNDEEFFAKFEKFVKNYTSVSDKQAVAASQIFYDDIYPKIWYVFEDLCVDGVIRVFQSLWNSHARTASHFGAESSVLQVSAGNAPAGVVSRIGRTDKEVKEAVMQVIADDMVVSKEEVVFDFDNNTVLVAHEDEGWSKLYFLNIINLY